MNPFDIFIVIVVAFCVIRGAFRGIIKEATSILGVILGIWAAYSYYSVLSKTLQNNISALSTASYANILAFLLIFCGVFILIGTLGVIIKHLLRIVFLSWMDTAFGAGFGFVKGFLIVAVLFMVLTTFLSPGTSFIRESVLSPYVASVSGAISRFASKDIRHRFTTKLDALKRSWKKQAETLIQDQVVPRTPPSTPSKKAQVNTDTATK